MKSIRRQRPEVIYSTSPYMSAHLIALLVSRRTGLPWVADFRDPWADNPFRELGFASLRHWDGWLERRVLRRASHVVCTTPALQDRLVKRLPFVARKCSTILNGFDGESIQAARPKRIAPAGEFVLTHCGQFYGPRRPTAWFAAVRRVLELSPGLEHKLHVLLIGAERYQGRHLSDLASAAGIGHCVRVLGEKGHAETLSYMAGSDALMLAGSTGPDSDLQVPGKLFEYLAMRKPIIAGVAASSPVGWILRQARVETAVCLPDDADALADAILSLISRGPMARASAAVDRFDRAHRAAELAELFGRVTRQGRAKPGRVIAAATAPQSRAAPEWGNAAALRGHEAHKDWSSVRGR